MTSKIALITGITGQDGAALARFLLARNYTVHGIRLYSATDDDERLNGVDGHPAFIAHYGDLTDGGAVTRLLDRIRPDELYNLGAQSHVGVSFDVPEATGNINALGTLRLLEAIRTLGLTGKTKFYQASSSEMFGNAPAPQSETTPFAPCSPYAVAKAYAYWMTRTYRDAYGMFACNGILFNHEGPQRGPMFVSRKIAQSVAAIAGGAQRSPLLLGNLDARRDWGHADDYVRGMWMMMQHRVADDFILATGQTHSVRDFVNAAFAHAGIKLHWAGQGADEKATCARTGRDLVRVDPVLFRPKDINTLLGDATKAMDVLGWAPVVNFETLVAQMVDAEMGPGHADEIKIAI